MSVIRALSATDQSDHFFIFQIKRLPIYFDELSINAAKRTVSLSRNALLDLFWIERKLPQDEALINLIAEIITRNKDRTYINHVLIPQLLVLPDTTGFTNKILLTCKQYLQERITAKPQLPANWSRQVPVTAGDKKQWRLLKAFLKSPTEQVFDYRKNQNERKDLENAITHVTIDLKPKLSEKALRIHLGLPKHRRHTTRK